MRNEIKGLDGLHIYLFDFMHSFSAMTLSFTFSSLRLECSRKITEVGVRRFKFLALAPTHNGSDDLSQV